MLTCCNLLFYTQLIRAEGIRAAVQQSLSLVNILTGFLKHIMCIICLNPLKCYCLADCTVNHEKRELSIQCLPIGQHVVSQQSHFVQLFYYEQLLWTLELICKRFGFFYSCPTLALINEHLCHPVCSIVFLLICSSTHNQKCSADSNASWFREHIVF